jgi:hypothetical protein
MKFSERVATVLMLAAAGISLSDGSASGGPMGNPAGSGYYYQQPQQQQQQGQHWYGQQQHQYGYEEPQQQPQEQNQPEENTGLDDGDESPLPPGWSEHIDPSSGQPYYYNANDGTTTWDRPMPEATEENKEELQEAPKEDVSVEATMELDAGDEIKEEPRGEPTETSFAHQYSSAGESHLLDSHQSDHEPRADTEPMWGRTPTDEQPPRELQQAQGWGMPTDESPQREQQQPQGWGMPQKERKPAEWNVRPEEMRKPEPEYKRDPVQKPPSFQGQPDRGFEQLQQQRDHGRDPMDKSRMYQEDPVQRNKPEQQLPAYQQPRGWQREMPKQEDERRPTSAAFDERPAMDPSGSQPPIAQEQGSPYQSQRGQPMQQRPPFQQQGPPEQQLGLSQQQKAPPQQGQQQIPPQRQQQQRPFQTAQSQNQMPPWQQQQQHQQPQRPQQQQGPPGYGQQGPYGQYNIPSGQGYGQYGQYGGAPPGYGQQGQNQLVAQSETVGAVKEALGSAWKGILGFGNRTKEVVGQAKETVVSTATAAGQTISATSQGSYRTIYRYVSCCFSSVSNIDYSLVLVLRRYFGTSEIQSEFGI